MKNIKNIIYLCNSEKGPSGGAKIIYDHSSHINKLKIPNISSEVLHIKKKGLRKWNTSIKKILNINYNNFSGWSVKDIDVCNNYLGYNFNINGIVVKGKSIGKSIGFPTANINITEEYIKSYEYIYKTYIKIYISYYKKIRKLILKYRKLLFSFN